MKAKQLGLKDLLPLVAGVAVAYYFVAVRGGPEKRPPAGGSPTPRRPVIGGAGSSGLESFLPSYFGATNTESPAVEQYPAGATPGFEPSSGGSSWQSEYPMIDLVALESYEQTQMYADPFTGESYVEPAPQPRPSEPAPVPQWFPSSSPTSPILAIASTTSPTGLPGRTGYVMDMGAKNPPGVVTSPATGGEPSSAGWDYDAAPYQPAPQLVQHAPVVGLGNIVTVQQAAHEQVIEPIRVTPVIELPGKKGKK